jgi:hypothetical protein
MSDPTDTPTDPIDSAKATTAADPFYAASPPEPARPAAGARTGIGFFTATVMSTIAAVGGAYLALFVQARPDLMQSTGIARVLPSAAKIQTAVDPAIADRLAALETKLTALEALLAAMPSEAPGQTTSAPATPAAASPAVPATAAPAAKGGAAPAVAPAPGTAAPTAAQASPPAAIAAIPTPGVSATDLAALGGRVTAIETRLAALDPTGAGGAVIAGLQTEIATLKVLVAQLQEKVAATPPAGVTLAVIALADAATRNGPFVSEFEAVRAALPGVAEASALEALARTGAPSRALLSERFSGLAASIAASEKLAQEEGGLVGWFRSLLSNLIRVEEPVTTEGKTSGAVLERARIKLEQGDLAGAVDDVNGIEGKTEAVIAWINGAKSRLELEQRVAALRGAVESGAYARPAAAVAPSATGPAAPAPGAPVVGVIPGPPTVTNAPGVPVPATPAPATKETNP